jgi:hypothetical protein
LDFDIDNDDNWHDAISDNVNHSDLFDACGDYKGRAPDLDVSSANVWFDTLTPDQHCRAQMEAATFACSEHAFRVQNFDNDDFNAVLLANDAELVDASLDDVPPAQAVCDTWCETILDDPDGTPDTAPSARTFKVHDPDHEMFTGDRKFRCRAPMPTRKSLCLSEILVLAMPTNSTV